MKLRVPGATTGYYGTVEFKDGVSVRPVSPKEANTLRAVMGGVEVLEDDGETIDEALNGLSTILPLGYYIDAGLPSPSPYLTLWDGSYPVLTEPVNEGAGEPNSNAPSVVQPLVDGEYTREQLEDIADKQGINGLRAIGEPLGVRARSVVDLITGILDYQAAKLNAAV